MLYQTENRHGGDIYGGIALDFSANVSPLGTPRSVTDAIERALPELYRYPDPYCRTLVQTISEYEGVPKNFVLCGNGASELIYAYCGAVRPKRAMELAPTFSEYSLALRRTGCEIVRFALKQEKNFDLRESFLPILAREKIDALFLCNPNNPTGRLIADDLLEEILRICREKNIALFVDECFLSLSDGGVDLTPSLSDFPQLFILKAFTKSFGMAGIWPERGRGIAAEDVGGGAAVECLNACTGGGRRCAGRCGVSGEKPNHHPRGAPVARGKTEEIRLLGVPIAGELHLIPWRCGLDGTAASARRRDPRLRKFRGPDIRLVSRRGPAVRGKRTAYRGNQKRGKGVSAWQKLS